MPSLLSLPYELLAQIASCCTEEHACNLRLVSSQLAHAAAPTIFQCFNLCCFESTVRKLQLISQSRMSRHVKQLTFHAVTLPHLALDVEEFEARFSVLFGDWYDSFMVQEYLPPRDRWAEVWLTLNNACRENSWFFSEIGQQSLQSIIASLPSLQKISIAEYHHYGETHPWHPRKLRPHLCSRICKSLDLETASTKHSGLAHTLATMGRSTAQGGTAPVTGPRDERYDAKGFKSGRLTWPRSTDEVERPNALERIKIFEHTCYSERKEDGDHLDFLSACDQLEDLSLKCNEHPRLWAHPPVDIRPLSAALKPGSPSSHLSRLKIANAHLIREDLCLFMTGHARTLTSLTISSSWSDDWRGVFQCIACSLRLRDVELDYLQDPSCIDPAYDLDKVFFKYGLKSDSDEMTWLLGERSKEPVLEPEWCDEILLGYCVTDDEDDAYEE